MKKVQTPATAQVGVWLSSLCTTLFSSDAVTTTTTVEAKNHQRQRQIILPSKEPLIPNITNSSVFLPTKLC